MYGRFYELTVQEIGTDKNGGKIGREKVLTIAHKQEARVCLERAAEGGYCPAMYMLELQYEKKAFDIGIAPNKNSAAKFRKILSARCPRWA